MRTEDDFTVTLFIKCVLFCCVVLYVCVYVCVCVTLKVCKTALLKPEKLHTVELISDSIRSEIPQRRLVVDVERSFFQVHQEVVGMDGHARVAVETRLLCASRQAHIERVHDRCEEQEELHSGENVAETHTTTDTERNEVLGLVHLALCVDEATRSEVVWRFPEIWVHVHANSRERDERFIMKKMPTD